jgi:monoterpene epsilon-lactone hydrolase
MDTKAKDDPTTKRDDLLNMAGTYLNGLDAKDPLVSPIYGDLRGLPPLMIQVGMREVLLDDSRKLAVRARADEVPVMLEQWPGMFHVWHIWADSLSDGRRALGGIGAFIRSQMG